MVLSVLNLAYIIGSNPFINKNENTYEFLNELTVYFCCQMMTTFLNIAIPHSLKDNMGWTYIGLVTLSILFNIALVLLSVCKDTWNRCRLRRYRKKALCKLDEKQKVRKDLIEKKAEGFEHL